MATPHHIPQFSELFCTSPPGHRDRSPPPCHPPQPHLLRSSSKTSLSFLLLKAAGRWREMRWCFQKMLHGSAATRRTPSSRQSVFGTNGHCQRWRTIILAAAHPPSGGRSVQLGDERRPISVVRRWLLVTSRLTSKSSSSFHRRRAGVRLFVKAADRRFMWFLECACAMVLPVLVASSTVAAARVVAACEKKPTMEDWTDRPNGTRHVRGFMHLSRTIFMLSSLDFKLLISR